MAADQVARATAEGAFFTAFAVVAGDAIHVVSPRVIREDELAKGGLEFGLRHSRIT